MNTSNPHQLSHQQTAADTTVVPATGRLERPAQRPQERTKRLGGMYLRLRPIRAATHEARHLHELERAGESEWTPWIALAGLILFFAAVGLLMFGIVEAAIDLLASASSKG